MGAQGLVEVDFGAHPGAVEKEVDVATAGVVATSPVEAWLIPSATTDHNVDEHIAMGDQLHVQGRYLSSGNIRIRVQVIGRPLLPKSSQLNQPEVQSKGVRVLPAETKTYGKWSVGWVWN